MSKTTQYLVIQSLIILLLMLALITVTAGFVLVTANNMAGGVGLMVVGLVEASGVLAVQERGYNRRVWSVLFSPPDVTMEEIHDELQENGDLEDWV